MDIFEFCSITGFSTELVRAVCRKEPGVHDTMRKAVQDKIDELQFEYIDDVTADAYNDWAWCMLQAAKCVYSRRETTDFWWVALSVQLAKCLEFLAKHRLILNGALHLDLQNNPKFKDLFYLCEQKTYMLLEMQQFLQLKKSEEDPHWDKDFNFQQHFKTLARVNLEDVIFELGLWGGEEMLPYPELILEIVEFMAYKRFTRDYRQKA